MKREKASTDCRPLSPKGPTPTTTRRLPGNKENRKIGICRAVKVRGRLDALPPAFTRGVARVAHTGAGGSPSSAFVSQKGAKNKNSNHRKIILFDALVPGIRTPPVPALAQGHPPHKCGGQGVYPPAYQNSPTNSNLSLCRDNLTDTIFQS